MNDMHEDTKLLIYLLKIMRPEGRQVLKDAMMERAGVEPEAGKLLRAINKVEMVLGQMNRMTDEERRGVGLPPKALLPEI